MSFLSVLPMELASIRKRAEFLEWICQQPLTFHDRLHIYFAWIDYVQTSYLDAEITQLKIGSLNEND